MPEMLLQRRVSYRRYLLFKHHAMLQLDQPALAGVWLSSHNALTGATDLPGGFPFRTLLAEAAYVAWEDLQGATAAELQRNVYLAPLDAQAVIDAFARLPIPE